MRVGENPTSEEKSALEYFWGPGGALRRWVFENCRVVFRWRSGG